MAAVGNAWYLRSGALAGGRWQVACYQSDDQPDGSTVAVTDVEVVPDDTAMLWRADLDGRGRSRVDVTATGAPGAPLAWFVAIAERQDDRPRMTLVAFCTGHLPDGTVVPNATFVTMPLGSASQAAAIRWWADTAVVDEIYVQPEHRRTQLGSKLIYVASGFHQHHGWPGRLHSDGRRTDLGQQFVVGLRHPERIAAWTHRAAPMTPRSGQEPV